MEKSSSFIELVWNWVCVEFYLIYNGHFIVQVFIFGFVKHQFLFGGKQFCGGRFQISVKRCNVIFKIFIPISKNKRTR